VNLADRLRERIKRAGPISFHDWMQAALYDESEGYYCRRDRIRQGRAGDYRTAPETSPLFAATFAKYFVKLFAELGSPSPFAIVEFGGGSGQFAHGVLTSLRSNHPEVFNAVNYAIEEVSASSREQCTSRLVEFSDRISVRSPRVNESRVAEDLLPEGRAFGMARVLFSNELVDAFPVHRVIGRGGKLRELSVGLDASNNFVWAETELSARVAEYCGRINLHLAEDQTFEVNLAADDFARCAASLINSGYLITVDYGAPRNDLLSDPNRFQGTLRTFHRHRLSDDVLSNPGERDLTTTIDWTQMIETGERYGLETIAWQRLDQFLLTQGAMEEIAAAVSTISDQAELFNYNAAARELIMPDGMAASFQVLVQRKDG